MVESSEIDASLIISSLSLRILCALVCGGEVECVYVSPYALYMCLETNVHDDT
jgi:hypothetical protein